MQNANSTWKPSRQELHRKLDVILRGTNRELKNTVKFVIVAAYRLTMKPPKS